MKTKLVAISTVIMERVLKKAKTKNRVTQSIDLRVAEDLATYHHGVKRGSSQIADDAKRSLLRKLQRHWPDLGPALVQEVFNNPKFVFYGELKQLIVKAARDHVLSTSCHPMHGLHRESSKSKPKREAEFYAMLEDEINFYSFATGCIDCMSPPNTWYSLESSYQSLLSDSNASAGDDFSSPWCAWESQRHSTSSPALMNTIFYLCCLMMYIFYQKSNLLGLVSASNETLFLRVFLPLSICRLDSSRHVHWKRATWSRYAGNIPV